MNGCCRFRLKNLSDRLTPNRQQKRHSQWFIHQWRSFIRWQDLVRDAKELAEEKRRIRNYLPIAEGFYISPEKTEDALPQKPLADQRAKETGEMSVAFQTNFTQCRYVDHSFDNIRRCSEYKRFQGLQYDQRFLADRYLFLGPDLAAAHFIVHRNGTVKFANNDSWYKKDLYGRYTLPATKTAGWYLEAIDASNTELMYEGFDNLYDLKHLRLLSVAKCPRINDWTLSRMGGIFSESLEMLDLSNCRRISAKGLLGLRSLTKLRFLRLEGLHNIDGMAKSALMLEEAIPNLIVLGLDYDKSLETLENEFKLLENDRMLIDAKGNVFAEDDNGRLFYVKGRVNERPVVDDDDKPLMQSLIRRELPKMDDAEFEKLDMLAGGKLRHFLLGSPSGYSWSQDVETILSFEDQLKRWDRIPNNPKLFPKHKRKELLRLSGKLYEENSPEQIAEEKKTELQINSQRI